MPIPDQLTSWFRATQRTLPFRETKDPYRIWISEIMLQQTQVDTALPYYSRFVESYPTIHHLAAAPEQNVLKLWEGLGYYSRAKNLLLCAKQLVHDYAGVFPTDYSAVQKLPGIGPYTAGAILSIAFDKKVPAVDGNVMRVISRLFDIRDDIALAKTKRIITEKVCSLIPEDAGDFNQGLMELGALICTPVNPRCCSCPLHMECEANAQNIQHLLPVKSKKQKPPVVEVAAAVVVHDNHLLMISSSTGLLSGLWGLPTAEGGSAEEAEAQLNMLLKEDYHLPLFSLRPLSRVKHVFSHKVWNITAYSVQMQGRVEDPGIEYMANHAATRWVHLAAITALPVSTAFKKITNLLP